MKCRGTHTGISRHMCYKQGLHPLKSQKRRVQCYATERKTSVMLACIVESSKFFSSRVMEICKLIKKEQVRPYLGLGENVCLEFTKVKPKQKRYKKECTGKNEIERSSLSTGNQKGLAFIFSFSKESNDDVACNSNGLDMRDPEGLFYL